MKKIIVSAWMVFVLFGFSAISQNPIDKIAPSLLTKDRSADVEVLISFERIDLSEKAKRIVDKDQKGTFIFQELLKHAKVSQRNVVDSLKNWEVKEFQSFHISNVIYTKVTQAQLMNLAKMNEVLLLSPNSSFYNEPIEVVSEDQIKTRAIEWGISRINADDVWAEGIFGEGVVVGGQDTGYEWEHKALKNKYRGWNGTVANHDYNWHDAIHEYNDNHEDQNNPCGLNSQIPCDDNNHGTHTMGTMVGDYMSNQIGVAPFAKWIGCRNMERGWGKMTTYLECFEWFLAPYAYGDSSEDGDPTKAPDVIANSWACVPEEGCEPSNFDVLETAVNNLRDAGIFVVVSAGNDGPNCNTIRNPAAIFESSFTVGATSSNDAIANFSSRGSVTVDGSGKMKPNVSAPGVSVRSSIRNNGYTNFSGTSMAGPHVVGAVALLIASNTYLRGKPDLIQDLLEITAIPMTSLQECDGSGDSIPNNIYGYGIIDVYAAYEYIETLLPVNWLDFKATDRLMSVELKWKTGSELNSDYFVVERSNNAFQWDSIAKIPAAGLSAKELDYRFVDEEPFEGIVYYRLKQVDYSYKYEYSVIRSVNRKNPEIKVDVSPNPTVDFVKVRSFDHDGFLEFKLYDMLGRTIHTAVMESDVPISVQMPKGAFIYQLVDKRGIVVKSGKIIGK